MSGHPPGFDPWTVQPINQSLYRLSYSGLLKYIHCCSKFRTGFVFSVPYFIGEESSLNCNFMKPESCRGWEDLRVTTSLEHAVPPLFDYLWNGKYRYVWHVSVFHKAVALLVPLLCWCIWIFSSVRLNSSFINTEWTLAWTDKDSSRNPYRHSHAEYCNYL